MLWAISYYIIFCARVNLRTHSHLLGLYAFPWSLMLTAAFRGHCHLPHDKYPLLWNICKIIFPCLPLSLPCLPFPEYLMTLSNRRDTAQTDCSLSYPQYIPPPPRTFIKLQNPPDSGHRKNLGLQICVINQSVQSVINQSLVFFLYNINTAFSTQ